MGIELEDQRQQYLRVTTRPPGRPALHISPEMINQQSAARSTSSKKQHKCIYIYSNDVSSEFDEVRVDTHILQTTYYNIDGPPLFVSYVPTRPLQQRRHNNKARFHTPYTSPKSLLVEKNHPPMQYRDECMPMQYRDECMPMQYRDDFSPSFLYRKGIPCFCTPSPYHKSNRKACV